MVLKDGPSLIKDNLLMIEKKLVSDLTVIKKGGGLLTGVPV